MRALQLIVVLKAVQHGMLMDLYGFFSQQRSAKPVFSFRHGLVNIEDILPKGPYLPCVSMSVRALLPGYLRYMYQKLWRYVFTDSCLNLNSAWWYTSIGIYITQKINYLSWHDCADLVGYDIDFSSAAGLFRPHICAAWSNLVYNHRGMISKSQTPTASSCIYI